MPRIVSNPWWIVWRPNPRAATRLFCFPYAGGNASFFQPWRLDLPEGIELYGIQLPGRANLISEPAFTRVGEVVTRLGPALLDLLDRPFAFFGHSMGAMLSFEVVRWLRLHSDVMPSHLFVSGRRAPQIPDTDPPLYLMGDDDLLAKLVELNGTQDEIFANSDLLRLVLPTIRADAELCETYVYTDDTPLSCPITAFAGALDLEETEARMQCWSTQTTDRFSLHVMQGDHFFVNTCRLELLKLLRLELSRTLSL